MTATGMHVQDWLSPISACDVTDKTKILVHGYKLRLITNQTSMINFALSNMIPLKENKVHILIEFSNIAKDWGHRDAYNFT